MFRVARLAKTVINIGLCLLLLLIFYLVNNKEGQFDTNLRENVLNDYDYYVDEYKDVGAVVLADINLNKAEKVVKIDINLTEEDGFPRKGADDSKEVVDDIVIAVASSKDEDIIKNEENNGENSQALEAPNETTDKDDVDVLRENDIIVDNVVIDRSEELLEEMRNISIEDDAADGIRVYEIIGAKVENSTNAYYKPLELIPLLAKPPSDRDAPGEFGHPFSIPGRMGPSVERQIEEGYRRHAFNVFASDVISVHRNLGDKREEECKIKNFRRPLPTFSVIICFRNEALSTLLRTMYSVLETAPGLLMKEVILVDDGGRLNLYELVKSEVEDLFSVKLIRSPEHVGITEARILGLKEATGEVLVFLDSHCECYEGWMEPLLDRIKENKNVVALPIMEIINPDNFKFSVTTMQKVQRGGFDWTLTYRWIQPPRDRFQNPLMDMTQPVASPTMSGGVFAIDRKYFHELGNYDKEMKIWGGENLEMSYRVWMCGGRIEILPCSHVGHVFKVRSPHDIPYEVVLRNKRRVAEVWMDDYKKLFYKRTPAAMQVDAGNVTLRHQLRQQLECKSFKWYIENIYPELYVPELKPKFSGAICCRFGGKLDMCVDTRATESVPGRLLGADRYMSGSINQYFEFTKQNEIRHVSVRDLCVTSNGKQLELQRCKYPVLKEPAPHQQWYINEDSTIVNAHSKLCLTASTSNVWLDTCEQASFRQKWRWI